MTRTLAAAFALVVASSAVAQMPTHYLHRGMDVPVPGGTADEYLDQTAPSATALTVLSLSLPTGATMSFPRFAGTALAAPVSITQTATLAGGVTVGVARLYMQANQGVKAGCMEVSAAIEQVDQLGVGSPLGSGRLFPALPGGQINGAGAAPIAVAMALPPQVAFAAGEALALTITLHNGCNANRDVRLVYDAQAAPSRLSFEQVDQIVKAKSLKGEFVTAYTPCTTPSVATNPPVALPACTALQSATGCTWGSKGAGKFSAGVSRTDVKLSASLAGLSFGCESHVLTVTADATLTTNDCTTTDDCTVTLTGFPVGSCSTLVGKCSVKTTLETFLGLGTSVFKEGKIYNIGLERICVFDQTEAARAFCAGVRVGP